MIGSVLGEGLIVSFGGPCWILCFVLFGWFILGDVCCTKCSAWCCDGLMLLKIERIILPMQSIFISCAAPYNLMPETVSRA